VVQSSKVPVKGLDTVVSLNPVLLNFEPPDPYRQAQTLVGQSTDEFRCDTLAAGGAMRFEVEQKFPVTNLAGVAAQLQALGAVAGPRVVQVDRYFSHPARDFAQTDEALRIRQVGEQNFITYKGPRIDQVTKTRQEIELPLEPGQASLDHWTELLQALRFQPVVEVRKLRQRMDLTWQDAPLEIALDQVAGVGEFVELETLADQSGLEAAQARVLALAAALGLTATERRSYLELVLTADGRRVTNHERP
jgi:adenylate cyclase, class 2